MCAAACAAGAPLAISAVVQVQNVSLDPSAVFSRALAVNAAVRAARQRVDQLRAKVGEVAGSDRFQAQFVGTASQSKGILPQGQGTESFSTFQGQINVPIPNHARNVAAIAGARADLRAADLGLRRAIADLAFQVNSAFYGLLKAQEALANAQMTKDQADRQVADTQKRVDAGDLPPADLLKSQVPAEEAQSALIRARNAERVAQQTLNSLLLAPLDAPIQLTQNSPVPQYSLPAGTTAGQAAREVPEVLIAEANLQSAQADVAVAKRGNDPSFALQATQTHSGDLTAYLNLATIGLTLTIPVFDGDILRNQVKEAVSLRDQAQSSLDAALQQAQLGIESALSDMESTKADVQATLRVLQIAQQSLDKARLAYDAGLTTTRDVLDAQTALAQARVDANNSKYDYILAVAKLKQLLGEQQP